MFPDNASLAGLQSVPTVKARETKAKRWNNGTVRCFYILWVSTNGTIIIACANRPILGMFSLQITPPSQVAIRFFFFFFGWLVPKSRSHILYSTASFRNFLYFCIFFHHGIQTTTSSPSLDCLAHCSKSSRTQRPINSPDTLGEPLLIWIIPHCYYRLYCRLSPVADCRIKHAACQLGLRRLSRPLPRCIFMGLCWRGTWWQNHAGSRE